VGSDTSELMTEQWQWWPGRASGGQWRPPMLGAARSRDNGTWGISASATGEAFQPVDDSSYIGAP
jgi:hypothetical protein